MAFLSFTILNSFSQFDSTYIYSYKEARDSFRKHRVIRVELSEIVCKKTKVPTRIKRCYNLEYISLRPRINMWAMPSGHRPCIVGFEASSIKSLPDWFINFKKLKELDLMGLIDFDLKTELKKIYPDNLEVLKISLPVIDDEMIKIISGFPKLKLLKIKGSLPDEEVEKIESLFPNCEVIISYAAYM